MMYILSFYCRELEDSFNIKVYETEEDLLQGIKNIINSCITVLKKDLQECSLNNNRPELDNINFETLKDFDNKFTEFQYIYNNLYGIVEYYNNRDNIRINYKIISNEVNEAKIKYEELKKENKRLKQQTCRCQTPILRNKQGKQIRGADVLHGRRK